MKHLKPVFLLVAITFLYSFCSLVPIVDAKIVFRIGSDIYVMNDDGSNRRRLTQNTVSRDSYPRWSPDGKRIAFTRHLDKKQAHSGELFIMDANGTNVQRLTDDNVSDNYPSWSPDGKKIAFGKRLRGINGVKSQVHVIDLATRNVTQLTGLAGAEGELGSTVSDWSPDGTEIIYEKFIKDRGKDIYVMSSDGEDQRPLFDSEPSMMFFPRWSADGKRVLFDDCTWDGNRQRCRLTVATLRGRTHQINEIYDKLGDDLLVDIMCWMDNDKAILFGLKLLNAPTPNYDIYRYDFNKQSLKRLTSGEENEKHPDWIEGPLPVSPQGKKKVTWGTLKQ